MKQHYLSKSDYLKYQTCPAYLWLWKNNRDVVPQDNPEDVEHRIEQGNEVESYARLLFPDGVLVTEKYQAAKYQTEELVAKGEATIFQATVITGENLLAMADVLEKDEKTGKWTIYEVKSTTEVKKEHVFDTAFQKAAFSRGGYEIEKVNVIRLNKEYVRHGKIDPEKLFVIENVDEKIAEIYDQVCLQLDDALGYIHREDEPKSCNCQIKPRSGHCPTFKHFHPEVPDYSVFNLTRISGKKLANLVDLDIYQVHEVPDDFELTENQKNQVLVAKLKEPIIYPEKIREELAKLKFPLYFLDYETISTAVPMFDGCTPYQQVPFQYSLHVMNSIDDPETKLVHREFLARKQDGLPVEKLLAQMAEDIKLDGGHVIVWNKSFEMSRNNEMGKMFPKYANFLEDVNGRVYDLMEIFSKQLHVHPGFLGKTSIKYVLPVLVPQLSYKELEIQNGGIACLRWYEMVTKDMAPEDAEKIYQNLLTYCHLDTLAMYKIYEHLMEV